MASLTSLGVHKPSALPFLVEEGILPSEPSDDTFKWQTSEGQGLNDESEEEEIVTTQHCVVWSRGGLIQRVFRFDIEKEPVTHAVFTHFPNHADRITRSIGDVAASNIPDELRTNGTLTVPKQRPSASKQPPSEISKDAPYVRDQQHNAFFQGNKQNTVSTGRALVIILKTQAHVFFVSGTSHIVHLPFEVDAVFPSINGVLLQRKLAQKPTVPPTPQLPSVPHNSFAFSQVTASSSPPSSQPLANLASTKDPDSPILPMLQNLLQRSTQAPENGLPRLFCLTDPLTEIGGVATKGGSKINVPQRTSANKSSVFNSLDPKESLLYVSPRDELDQDGIHVPKKDPLMLAVTEHEDSKVLNIWIASYVDHKEPNAMQRQPSATTSGAVSRRRSSFAPGMGTGTTTPTMRGTNTGRDSFGGARSRRHVSTDPGLDDLPTHDKDDKMESVFGNLGVAAKSSRRVSGLLARTDLSANHDRSAFSDLAGAHGNKGGRKGASFGAYGSRLSAGPENGVNMPKPHSLHGIRTSLDSVSLYEHQLDDLADALDDLHDLRDRGDLGLHAAVRGLKTEIVFTKIYSMPGEGRKMQLPLGNLESSARQIITMKTPDRNLGDSSSDDVIVMCLIDRMARESLVLQVNVSQPQNSHQSHQDASRVKSIQYRARVSGMTRRAGVIDACRVSHDGCSRLLVLDESKENGGELSLQAPWTSIQKIELPSKLFLHNPHQIANDVSLRQRRESGFKRILSQGPQSLIGFQHVNSRGRFDVVDTAGVKHRLQLQFRPKGSLVDRMIRVSDSVLPSSEVDGESILRGWWDTVAWLQGRSEAEADIEWTAIVVLLFSMAVAFMSDRRTEAAPRQKKKKGGLLRSSSGANTNLDSWEAMINQEATRTASKPAWMQTGAWEWAATEKIYPYGPKTTRSSGSFTTVPNEAVPIPKKSSFMIHCISLARDFIMSPLGQMANGTHGYLPTASSRDPDVQRTALPSILVALHLLREELKLDVLATSSLHQVTPVLAQLGTWLGWENWGNTGYYSVESEDMDAWLFEELRITALKIPPEPFAPPSIFQFIESINLVKHPTPMISLLDVASSSEAEITRQGSAEASERLLRELTPRTIAITGLLAAYTEETIERRVAKMASWGLNAVHLETLPESVAAPFRAAVASCQARPPTSWDSNNLKIIGREDVAELERDRSSLRFNKKSSNLSSNDSIRDVHTVCHLALEHEAIGWHDASAEHDRPSITRLLFKEDQRFAEAAKLVHPLHYPVARCTPEPEWSDTDLLEAQQELVKVIAMRTLSLSPGRALLIFGARFPLLTERFPIHGFTLSCIMKPSDTTVTADRTHFTEEKTSWAFFHAGVEAGLSISQEAKGVDTSWILFNKPRELNNRHAGFLLALGLNGHLRSIAKWVAFKYLTPKHTMTSIGLLLGLSASYLGTMDTLITRLLSVHVVRMLPPGAAELNLSPLTQTSGIMGIGLLYCNTQHRRMSEIMLTEMENTEQDETNPLESLRDEGYRLAAGFALGYINLGRGKDLKGLHDMHLAERLLVLAVGTRKVSIVHILDKAAAAATVAIALVFMKTQDEALARKIDIPDTPHQFDYVRPDTFLLRTVARHLIMWNNIRANSKWISVQLPLAYRNKSGLTMIRNLSSDDMPFFNVIAGICLSIGLRFAGSGSLDVRNLLCHYIDQFVRICRLSSLSYDGKLARATVRNCQDVVALAASCVMAGTGDLQIFRRLRSLHGRTDVDTPYGSHLATHLAIGVLFLGGGTHTFGTSNIAVASLLCAFYPLFPNTVLDNKSHLQAFRHFWVLATEPRCVVPRDVDTHRPISLPISVILRTGDELAMTAPCLLPELDTISKISTNDPEYWSVTLDIANNPSHHKAFTRHQSIFVRRRAAYDAHGSVFSATMQALNDAQTAHQFHKQGFRWVFSLPTFARFDRAEQALVLPVEAGSGVYKGTRGTVVDDRLVLEKACLDSGRAERLWNLRILFAWAEGVSRRGEECGWLGKEVVEGLRAKLALRRWSIKES